MFIEPKQFILTIQNQLGMMYLLKKTFLYVLALYFTDFKQVSGKKDSLSVIIIAAASKLFQDGFRDVTILEAESRIGGRICTTKFSKYYIILNFSI